MSYRKSSLMIYMRPAEYQPSYMFDLVAEWLAVRNRTTVRRAMDYILYLERHQSANFKAVFSNYLAQTEQKRQKRYDINNYTTGGSKSYGNDEHMWW